MLENMLDYVRIALYSLLILIGFLIFQAWEKDHPTVDLPPLTQTENMPAGRFVPQANVPTQSALNSANPTQAVSSGAVVAASPSAGQIIKVSTDTFEVSIDTHGGDIVEAKLVQYPESLHSKTPFLLLNDNDATRYIAESGLIGKEGPDTSENQALYTVSQSSYALLPGINDLAVKLTWQNKEGLKVNKIYSFSRGSYEIHVTYEIDNQSQQAWTGNLYTQLMRTNTPPVSQGGLVNLATYFGAGISSPDKRFEKITFKQMQEKNLNQAFQGGWAAMIQHYFISAWVPPKDSISTYYSRVLPNGLYTIGMIGQPLTVQPGTKVSTEAKLYSGPAIGDELKKTAPWLQLTIDYGWFWFISLPIFWMMQLIHDWIGNWGWAIVLVTIIIKIIFYPLSAKSYRSMSGLKRLQPKLEALKERYGDDRQKMTQATLDLYRQEKVNPMSGCLPILIQIPVFIALYWVLVESVQLRQAPFILWIHDLSQQDPYYILPVLMGLSMFAQQRLNPPPPDPMQAKVMMAMPLLFTVLFAKFPAGLMLYWFVNNTLSLLQQWHIMRSLDRETNGKNKKS